VLNGCGAQHNVSVMPYQYVAGKSIDLEDKAKINNSIYNNFENASRSFHKKIK
jgi:hypothetical protein